MSIIENFKHQLVCVFDDNMHTKAWHNIADWAIIALIIISSIEVFLSTFAGIAERYGGLLQFIDIFTTIVFTVEVSLRIWVADLIDEKYKGFWGRVRYCFSFYGLLDFLSTYPFYLGLFVKLPVSALKVLRVARLLRIFRYMKSFRILGQAISSKKQELTISFVFLSILTVILSFLLYFAEHDAQPFLCENGWKTLVWAFAKYLGDPAKIADFPLVTFWGRIIAAIVGILGIAIFAVPAGLVGSGFVEAIEQRNHEKEIADNAEAIRHSFRWEKDTQYTGLLTVPPFIPLGTLLMKYYLTEKDVIEAVKNTPNLHLYNLAKAYNIQDSPADKLVVVDCAYNRPYGCCIDRGSKVTIVSTSGFEEPITSWVAYHIAKIGGFNYVARDIETNPDEPVSYYNITDVKACPNIRQYLEDINRLSSSPDSWVIPMCFCCGPAEREYKIHLCYSPVKHDNGYENPDKTFQNTGKFDRFASDFSSLMEMKYGLKTDKNEYYVVQAKVNVLHHINCKNGFVLRLESAPFYFAADKVARIQTIADVLNRHFDDEVEKTLPGEMLERPENCFGFSDYVCCT